MRFRLIDFVMVVFRCGRLWAVGLFVGSWKRSSGGICNCKAAAVRFFNIFELCCPLSSKEKKESTENEEN
jgi:hypothetical protein